MDGTWCPIASDCTRLVDGINALYNDTGTKTEAYRLFLEDRPAVNDPLDNGACGQLREYLGYDADYADDERIIEETERLECEDDIFAALSGFSGGSGGYDVPDAIPSLQPVNSGECPML